MSAGFRSFVLGALLLGLAAAAMAAAWLGREQAKPAEEKETVTAVRALSVSPAPRRPVLFLTGKAEARDYATLTAPLEAEVISVDVREGEYFNSGRRLLRFDLRELLLTQKQQLAEKEEIHLRLRALLRNRKSDALRLADARRLLELAKRDYERNRGLLAGGAVTEAQTETSEQLFRQRRQEFTAMENLLADYETQEQTAQAQLERAGARIAQTNLLLERSQMRAPFSGRAVRVHAAAGQRAMPGARLLEIFNPKRLRLRVALPQSFAAAANDSLRAVLPGVGEKNSALTLAFDGLEPRVDSGAGSVDVFFALPGGEWVLGATHEARIELPPRENLIAVPVDAIYNDDRVYLIGSDGRVRAEFCARAGLGKEGEKTSALLHCPGINNGARIVANQLPQLVESAKVEVIE